MKRQVKKPSPKRDLEDAECESYASKKSKIVICNDSGNEKIDALKVKTSDLVQDNDSPFLSPEVPASNHHQNAITNNSALDISPETSQLSEGMSTKTNGTAESAVTQNGSCDQVTLQSFSIDYEPDLELPAEDSESNVASTEDPSPNDNKPMPVLSAENLEIHNSESTDSFQSEGFDAFRCASQMQQKESASSQEAVTVSSQEAFSVSSQEVVSVSGQEARNVPEVEKSTIKSIARVIDLDVITMSHLEVTQLEGHSDIIYSVAADEDLVLSSSGDTTVRVWNLVDKTMVCNFSGHKDSITSVYLLTQIQSDWLKLKLEMREDVSRIAITGSLDCTIKLWSVYEGKELASIYTFNGITSLGYLESDSLVVIGTEGGKLELWDVCNPKAVHSVKAHEDSVSDLKVHDSNIYTVSSDGSVKVWLFEDDELYPVYTRKRKEKTQDNHLGPSHWKSVATSDNILYLGDDTKHVKVLDSVAGRLRLFKNQLEPEGVCECVTVDKDILLTTFYETLGETGGINVWKIPEMSYICTLTGDNIQDVCSLAVVRKEGLLRIISGGHQLLIWDFDFSRSSNKGSEDPYTAVELETLGREIAESTPQTKKKESLNKSISVSNENSSDRKWCNIM